MIVVLFSISSNCDSSPSNAVIYLMLLIFDIKLCSVIHVYAMFCYMLFYLYGVITEHISCCVTYVILCNIC